MKRPYLLSVGIGLPIFGVWFHRYLPVRQSRRMREIRFLGFRAIWVSYCRIEEVP